MTGDSPYELARAGICHVPEGRGIFPSLSVADNLRLQAPRSVDRRAIGMAAAVFPASSSAAASWPGPSRVASSRCWRSRVPTSPSRTTVLLDEVSMGLAPKIVDEIFDYLARLAAEGISLLVVEQYVARALELADYVYILNRGRIRFAGEPAEVGDQTVLESYLGSADVMSRVRGARFATSRRIAWSSRGVVALVVGLGGTRGHVACRSGEREHRLERRPATPTRSSCPPRRTRSTSW